MKSERERFVSSGLSEDVVGSHTIDRRCFLRLAAGTGAMVHFGRSAFGLAQNEAAAAAQPGGGTTGGATLPDGSQYASWEQPLTFSKTYYVDNTSAHADDSGPGSKTRPFRTISKAAQML